MNKLLYNRYYRLILRILLLILCIILTGCSTSSNTPTVSDRRVQQTSVNITNKCSTTDENGNNTGTISDELLGTGHEIDIPEAVGSKQVPGSVTVVQPKEGAEWLFSGTNPEGAAEPCKTVFDKWRANGGKWNDGLAAIANVPIVAIPERLAKDAVGDDIFNNKWKGVGVGCFIDIYYSDGHFVRILVGDTKNPSDSTAYMYDGKHWGHQCGNGVSMIEPWQSKDDYFDNKVPGNSGYHDDLSGTMTKWYVYENKVQDMDTANLTMSSNTSGKKSNNSNSSSTTNTSYGSRKKVNALKESDLTQFKPENGNYSSKFLHGKFGKNDVKWIVLHDTELEASPEDTAKSWMSTNDGYVAAHFVVGRDGTIVQCVPLDTIAHHAGSGDEGNDDKFDVKGGNDDKVGAVMADGYPCYGMNGHSIGIELCHKSDTQKDYPDAQLDALDRLIAYIDETYSDTQITCHREWRSSNSDTSDEFNSQYLDNYKTTRTHDGNTSATDSGDDIDECDSDGNKTNASIGEGAEGAVEWAIRVANSKNVGYTQDEASQESETGRESIKKYDGSTKTVEQKRSSDCTAFVWYAWMIGGKNTKCEEVSPHWGPATGYFDSYYPKAGFEKHQLTDTSQLQAGDVLWRDGHAALYIGDGKIAQESWNENHDISGGQVGDQLQTSEDGEEDNIGECNITELSQVSLPFTYYWRYTGSSSSSS